MRLELEILIVVECLWTILDVKCLVYVNTKLGTIKGLTMLSRNGTKFNAFLGIPYAEPPINDLRFQNPVEITKPWSGVLDATKYPPKCIQPLQGKIDGKEDCLYLNLYSPKTRENAAPWPVWVFIYGGKKLFGDAAPYKYGPEYIMDKPVILVTMSYRMGAFGFLSTEDNVISGNFGLKDETAVLVWIKKHIHSFGGDPTNVTLSGGSSGGIDASLHIYSPLSKGLFHKAISQSGHALNAEVVHAPGSARRLAWSLAEKVGCKNATIKTSENLAECLKKIPALTLAKASSKLMHDYILPFMLFGPVIESRHNDGAFLTNDPCRDIEISTNIPWILGSIPDEGSQRTLTLFSKPTYIRHFQKHADELLAEYFRYTYHPNAVQVTRAIKQRYMTNKFLNESFYEISRIYAFSNFHLGTIETALRYKGPLYLYCYDYRNDFPYLKVYLDLLSSPTKYKIGAVHGEELVSLFNNPLMYPPVMAGNDRIVSDQVVDLWYNFVAYGDPNGKNGNRIWEPVSALRLQYLHINNLTLTMKENYFLGEEYEFWKEIGSPTLCSVISNSTI